MNRKTPKLVAGRTSKAEHALIIAAATARGQTMNAFVREVCVREAMTQLGIPELRPETIGDGPRPAA